MRSKNNRPNLQITVNSLHSVHRSIQRLVDGYGGDVWGVDEAWWSAVSQDIDGDRCLGNPLYALWPVVHGLDREGELVSLAAQQRLPQCYGTSGWADVEEFLVYGISSLVEVHCVL